jgi:hypothetical protein
MCAHENTHLQLGRKHESKDAKRYTYQTQTVKPFLVVDSVASVTELIASLHFVAAVPVPHVAGVICCPTKQALCAIQYDKVHASLTERDEGNWKHDRT